MMMTWFTSRYMELINDCCQKGYPQDSCKFSKRYLCVLGQILRHGSSIVEEKSLAPDFQVLSQYFPAPKSDACR